MHFTSKSTTLFTVLALSACTTIPVSSMLALSRIDFATTQIEELRIAVEIPNEIRPRKGGVHMDVVATIGAQEDKYSFKLEEDQAQIGMKGLLPFPEDGKKMYAYRLSDADVATLIQLRSERLNNKKEGEKGSLSVGVAAKEFCRVTSLAKTNLTVSTYIAASETKGFIALIRNFDLRSEAKIADSIATMPLCSK